MVYTLSTINFYLALAFANLILTANANANAKAKKGLRKWLF